MGICNPSFGRDDEGNPLIYILGDRKARFYHRQEKLRGGIREGRDPLRGQKYLFQIFHRIRIFTESFFFVQTLEMLFGF